MLNILNAKLIVIKIGSSLLFTSNKTLRLKWVQSLVDDISLLLRQNLKIVIVTSGAIALGCKKLKINKKNLKLNEYQAVAALGQIELMNIFKNAFSKKRINVAQILLTLNDTENRRRSLNAKDTIRTLHKINILPIVNENDTTATSEIRYGDNDRLAARVAQITEADTLIMLSDIDGLFTKNPKKYKDAKIINKITKIDKRITDSATKSLSDYGSGGMITKIEAAKICMNTGCNMIISNGLKNNPVKSINKFKKFTWFVPKTNKVNSKKKWILSSNKEATKEQIDSDYEKYADGLKWQLIENSIVKDQNIKVEGSELLNFAMELIGNQYAQYGMMIPGEDELKKAAQNVLSNQEEARKLNDMIYDRKVMDYLKNTLKITDKEISHEDFVKKSAEAIQ